MIRNIMPQELSKNTSIGCSSIPKQDMDNLPLKVITLLLKKGVNTPGLTRFASDLAYQVESRGRALTGAEAFVFAQLWSLGYLDSFTSEPASTDATYESGYAFGYAEGQHPIEDNDHDYTN